MRFGLILLSALTLPLCAADAQYTLELTDGSKFEVVSYIVVGEEYKLRLPDGSSKSVKKADVSEVAKRKIELQPLSAEDNSESSTAKNEVAFQTLRERMATAHGKRIAIPIPEFKQRSVRNGITVVTTDNSQEIAKAQAERKQLANEIILANKLLLAAVKSQAGIDYGIYKKSGETGPIVEPQLPEMSLTVTSAPTFVTVDSALELNALTAMVKDARYHWVLAMTKGGLFDGKYIPAIEDIQYARNYLKWQMYKNDKTRRP
jgi:hypothetical protein